MFIQVNQKTIKLTLNKKNWKNQLLKKKKTIKLKQD